jgi:hypothetical protein
MFFAQPIAARQARMLGTAILTKTMENRPELGLASYDRMFPNQDWIPEGGFGNLIALPLQKIPRGQGNSVFIDDQGYQLKTNGLIYQRSSVSVPKKLTPDSAIMRQMVMFWVWKKFPLMKILKIDGVPFITPSQVSCRSPN